MTIGSPRRGPGCVRKRKACGVSETEQPNRLLDVILPVLYGTLAVQVLSMLYYGLSK